MKIPRCDTDGVSKRRWLMMRERDVGRAPASGRQNIGWNSQYRNFGIPYRKFTVEFDESRKFSNNDCRCGPDVTSKDTICGKRPAAPGTTTIINCTTWSFLVCASVDFVAMPIPSTKLLYGEQYYEFRTFLRVRVLDGKSCHESYE